MPRLVPLSALYLGSELVLSSSSSGTPAGGHHCLPELSHEKASLLLKLFSESSRVVMEPQFGSGRSAVDSES